MPTGVVILMRKISAIGKLVGVLAVLCITRAFYSYLLYWSCYHHGLQREKSEKSVFLVCQKYLVRIKKNQICEILKKFFKICSAS
jgi:uncharacterized membrane protein